MEEFIAYGFYTERIEELPRDRRRQIAEFITRVEEGWGVQFLEGRNPDISFMW